MTPHNSTRGSTSRIIPERPRPIFAMKVIVLRLGGGAVALWGLLSLIGVLVKHVLNTGRAGSMDRSVDIWLAAHRRASLNTMTSYANDLANTRSIIAITVVVALLLRWRFVNKLEEFERRIAILEITAGIK